DDPVAPVPDVLLAVADLLTQTPPVAVTPDVHPVAAPALAVLRAREQPVHDFFISVGRGVREESLLLLARRRQADEVAVHAAEQQPPVGGPLRGEPAPGALGGEEGVDRVADGGAVGAARHGRAHGGAKGPVVARVGFGLLVGRPAGALVDPPLEEGDLLRAERLALAGRGHAAN